MSKIELKEMIKVMQHYDSGGVVEFSEDDFKVMLSEANEKDDGDLCWNWAVFDYRIKETKQKITIEKWLWKNLSDDEHIIVESTKGYDNLMLESHQQIKLLETYEVEL